MANNALLNGAVSLHSRMHTTVDMSAHASRIAAPQSILPTQSSNVGLNGRAIKSEVGYSGNSSYMFGGVDGNVVEARQTIGDVSVAPFSGMEASAQPMNEPLLEPDTSSFGFLGQIPRNFSLSDLTADFSQSSGRYCFLTVLVYESWQLVTLLDTKILSPLISDILESYARSPFLASETENFMDIREREHEGAIYLHELNLVICVLESILTPHLLFAYLVDNKRSLDTISEGLSYEDFGSDS